MSIHSLIHKILVSILAFSLLSYAQGININLENSPIQNKPFTTIDKSIIGLGNIDPVEALTEEEKQEYLSKLYSIYDKKELQRQPDAENAKVKNEAQIAQAIHALSQYNQTGEQALNFFYECYKKIHYTDKGLDLNGFKLYKEKTEKKYNTPTVRADLQWSMLWLILELRSKQLTKGDVTEAFKEEVESLMTNYYTSRQMKPNTALSRLSNTLRNYVIKIYDIKPNPDFNFPSQYFSFYSWYKIQRINPAIENNNLADFNKYWTDYISLSQLAVNKTTIANTSKFIHITKPNLLMEQATQLYYMGHTEQAVTDSFAIIKQYPNHPNNKLWVRKTLRLTDPDFTN